MAGASRNTRRVRYINANRTAASERSPGVFEFLIVTEDDVRHTVAPDPTGAATLLTMIRASPVLLWDPDNQALIGANIVGDWLPEDWSGLPLEEDREQPLA